MSTRKTNSANQYKGSSENLEVLSAFGEGLGGRRDGLGAVAAETHFVIGFSKNMIIIVIRGFEDYKIE